MQGAQRELMKYWSRVSGNRWLVAKMFGVLMVRLHAFQVPTMNEFTHRSNRFSSYYGFSLQAKRAWRVAAA